jgi:hypothetical protein
MECPYCGQDDACGPSEPCPRCGKLREESIRVAISQTVQENSGKVIGFQAGSVSGTVHCDITQLQLYVAAQDERSIDWFSFLEKRTSPYKFLSSYTFEDRALFKGRDEEIKSVLSLLARRGLLVISGKAGCGKTSLMAAGVTPAVYEHGAMVLHLHDYRQPDQAVYQALSESSSRISIALPSNPTFSNIIDAMCEKGQGTVVLILDQFERVFEQPDESTCSRELIGKLIEKLPSDYLRPIIVLRDDLLGRLGALLAGHEDLVAYYPVPLLTRKQAQAAIEQPLAKLNYPVTIEGDLVSQEIVPDLIELNDVEPKPHSLVYPPHLQIVCDYLFRKAYAQDHRIDRRLYLSLSDNRGAEGILSRYLQDRLDDQLADQSNLARQVLLYIASPGVEYWIESDQIEIAGADSRQIRELLVRLVEFGLLIPGEIDGRPAYAFASQTVKQEAIRLGGPELEKKLRAKAELKRVYTAWAERKALADHCQLHYIAKYGTHLSLGPVEALLLLRSAVEHDDSPRKWVDKLDTAESRELIARLEGSHPDRQTSTRSPMCKASELLGITAKPLYCAEMRDNVGEYGAVAWSAVASTQPETRQTAALALRVPYHQHAIDRLDWALRAVHHGRRWRKAELRGALTDIDPGLGGPNSELPFIDRFLIWLWRFRRRVVVDRYRITALTIGGAIGMGLGLALLRVFLGILARLPIGIEFATSFYWASILGGALALGIALTDSLLSRSEELKDELPPLWTSSHRPNLQRALLVTVIGCSAFGMAHLVVAWFNGLSMVDAPLVAPLGFIGGLVLAAALYDQPQAGLRLGVRRWLLRLGVVAAGFASIQIAFGLVMSAGVSLAVTWPGIFYKAKFSYYLSDFANLDATRWYDVMAILDAVAVGLVLFVGFQIGLHAAVRWLSWWRSLVNRLDV